MCVPWSYKCQHVVSQSSAKVEYRDAANVVAEVAWLHNLLELHCHVSRFIIHNSCILFVSFVFSDIKLYLSISND